MNVAPKLGGNCFGDIIWFCYLALSVVALLRKHSAAQCSTGLVNSDITGFRWPCSLTLNQKIVC